MADPQNPNQMSRLFQSAGSTQAKQGTGYTNLGRLLSASKDNLLGQKVAGNIGTQIGGVQQQLAEQQKQFGEESEKSKIGGTKDIEQREAVLGRFTSPSGPGGDVTEEDVSAFERFRGGQYAGPQGLKDTSALKGTAQQLQSQVSSFSPSGTQELLRRTVGGDRYTQGQQRLDTLLMDKSKLTPIARQAQGLGQQISRADLAASGQAELQKNLAKQFAQETQEKLTAGMGGIDTAVQGQLAAAQAQEKDRIAKIAAVQAFAANKTPKLDASGNPVLDQYGNVQYDTTAKVRGDGDRYAQTDYLKNLLSGQGAQQAELKQLFGTRSATEAGRAYNQELSKTGKYEQAGAIVNTPGDERTQVKQAAQLLGIPIRYDFGSNDYVMLGTKQKVKDMVASGGRSDVISAANTELSRGTGLAGQSLLGGGQEGFYQTLAKTLGGSTAAQGLTEGGLASEKQRASYEALNRLMGKTASESKYRKDDPTKYEAGKFLLNPELIKSRL